MTTYADTALDTFAHRLHVAKARSGHSIPSLAAAVGVCTNQVERWLYGPYEPQAYYLRRLCRALDVSADWLLGLEE